MTGTRRCAGIFFLFFLVSIVAGRAQETGAADCSGCHDQGQKMAASAHAEVTCNQCHEKHKAYPHPEGAPKPVCSSCHMAVAAEHGRGVHGQAAKNGNSAAPDCAMCHGGAHEVQKTASLPFRQAVPETCGMCHSEVAAQFQISVHGKAIARGATDAASCTDCHGEHSILAPRNITSPVNAANIRDTCSRCHADVRLARRFQLPLDRITSFDESFHGLAAKSGSQTVANCASCHGVHNILASSESASTVHDSNLPATCGKCHPGAGSRFAIGKIHWVEGQSEPASVRTVRLFYLVIIPLTLGMMLLHHGGDLIRKLFRMRLKPLPGAPLSFAHYPAGGEIRMLTLERVQHALLLASFTVLVWTGFALKYPDTWWALPLVMWESSWPVRGTIHRAAGAVMMAVAVMHILTLCFSAKLRKHWLTLWPKSSDLFEFFRMLSFNLGLRGQRPHVSAHSYVEKAEYWAVIWGTFIMALTGIMLWANKYTLAWLPKEWLDVAMSVHFYEAVLASAAIVIWHFYTVIFDPEVYPMDPAWLTGRSVRQRDLKGLGAHHAPGRPAQAETKPEVKAVQEDSEESGQTDDRSQKLDQ